VVGLWQTLEGLLGCVWLLGIGGHLFRAGQRVRGVVALSLGDLLLLLAVARLAGV
jgi:hypothetical protein